MARARGEAHANAATPEDHRRLIGQLAAALAPLALSLGIERTPGVAGGSACIVRTRIPVWVLESYRRGGASEAELLRSFPTLNAADLVSAWLYVETHPDEIDEEIRRNDAP